MGYSLQSDYFPRIAFVHMSTHSSLILESSLTAGCSPYLIGDLWEINLSMEEQKESVDINRTAGSTPNYVFKGPMHGKEREEAVAKGSFVVQL